MSDLLEIKKYLRSITGVDRIQNVPLNCEITKVEGITCSVKIAGGLELTDVRLKATNEASSDYFVAYPKVGSKAIVISTTGELDDLMLLRVDEIEKIEWKQAGLEVIIDTQTGKVSVKNQQVSLIDLFDAVFNIITNLKVTTPAGPSTGILPDSVTSLTQFKTNFQNLLN